MTGKILASVEHFLTPGSLSNSVQTGFTAIWNMLASSGSQIGVTRVALGTVGVGEPGYPGSTSSWQDNSWACFRFNSASYPWDLWFMGVGATTIGSDSGLFANASTTTYALAFAAAGRIDGLAPWNGTSGSTSNEQLGSPRWVTGSAGGWIFPRSNDPVRGGVHNAGRENMTGFDTATNGTDRWYFYADKDSFAAYCYVSNGATPAGLYIGPYTPISGTSVVPQIPYVAVFDATLPVTITTQYGLPGGTGVDSGAILFPTASISGTCSVGFDRYGTGLFQNVLTQPSKLYPTASHDLFPLLVGPYEPTFGLQGALGWIDSPFFQECYNASQFSTSLDKSNVVIGSTTLASIKMVAPYSSGALAPGTSTSARGSQFTIP